MNDCVFCGADRALPDGSCGACGCPAPAVWLIVNRDGDYWSNEDGWVDNPSADRFTDAERNSLNLPIEGRWLRACPTCQGWGRVDALVNGKPGSIDCPDCESTEPFSTGKNDGSIGPIRHATLAAAEAWIAERQTLDPGGVERGDYYIDAPESYIGQGAIMSRARCPDCGIPTIPDREGLTDEMMRCDRCEAARV